MIVRKRIDPPWKQKSKNGSFDDSFIHLGLNGEFRNAKEIKTPIQHPLERK